MTYHIGIIYATYNSTITQPMLHIVQETITKKGHLVTRRVEVPGVYDMAVILKTMLQKENIDGVVLIGAVIKGRTDHDQIVATNTARIAMDLSVIYEKPVALAIMGPRITLQQAIDSKEAYAQHAAESIITVLKEKEKITQ